LAGGGSIQRVEKSLLVVNKCTLEPLNYWYHTRNCLLNPEIQLMQVGVVPLNRIPNNNRSNLDNIM
jgi:hypothetical protein